MYHSNSHHLLLISQKGTKNDLETGRTFATIFSDLDNRTQLLNCHTEEDFKRVLGENTKAMIERMSIVDLKEPAVEHKEVQYTEKQIRFFVELGIYP